MGHGAVRLHEEGRPVFRARDDGRQGPRALGALRGEGGRGRGRAREHPGSLGVRGGDRLAELREGRRGGGGRSRDGLGHRLGHDLDRARQAGRAGGPPRPAGHALHARDGHDRPALRRDGRRRAQPDRRAHAARRRLLRREDRAREDPRLLRRRRRAVEGRARGLPEVRLHGGGLQEGPPLQVHPHERRARRDEAHLGDAHVRGPRRRRRLHGPGRQDDHPAARRGESLLPPRPEPDGGEDREAHHEVREVQEQGRRRSPRRPPGSLPGRDDGPPRRRRATLGEVRVRQGAGLRARGRLDRRRRHDGEGPEGAHLLPRPLPPEHGYHAPNENYDWEQAEGGMVAFAKYFAEVAAMGKTSYKPSKKK